MSTIKKRKRPLPPRCLGIFANGKRVRVVNLRKFQEQEFHAYCKRRYGQ